ncbi:Uncharacterized protein QTN25_006088 [Entamoeba marina]
MSTIDASLSKFNQNYLEEFIIIANQIFNSNILLTKNQSIQFISQLYDVFCSEALDDRLKPMTQTATSKFFARMYGYYHNIQNDYVEHYPLVKKDDLTLNHSKCIHCCKKCNNKNISSYLSFIFFQEYFDHDAMFQEFVCLNINSTIKDKLFPILFPEKQNVGLEPHLSFYNQVIQKCYRAITAKQYTFDPNLLWNEWPTINDEKKALILDGEFFTIILNNLLNGMAHNLNDEDNALISLTYLLKIIPKSTIDSVLTFCNSIGTEDVNIFSTQLLTFKCIIRILPQLIKDDSPLISSILTSLSTFISTHSNGETMNLFCHTIIACEPLLDDNNPYHHLVHDLIFQHYSTLLDEKVRLNDKLINELHMVYQLINRKKHSFQKTILNKVLNTICSCQTFTKITFDFLEALFSNPKCSQKVLSFCFNALLDQSLQLKTLSDNEIIFYVTLIASALHHSNHLTLYQKHIFALIQSISKNQSYDVHNALNSMKKSIEKLASQRIYLVIDQKKQSFAPSSQNNDFFTSYCKTFIQTPLEELILLLQQKTYERNNVLQQLLLLQPLKFIIPILQHEQLNFGITFEQLCKQINIIGDLLQKHDCVDTQIALQFGSMLNQFFSSSNSMYINHQLSSITLMTKELFEFVTCQKFNTLQYQLTKTTPEIALSLMKHLVWCCSFTQKPIPLPFLTMEQYNSLEFDFKQLVSNKNAYAFFFIYTIKTIQSKGFENIFKLTLFENASNTNCLETEKMFTSSFKSLSNRTSLFTIPNCYVNFQTLLQTIPVGSDLIELICDLMIKYTKKQHPSIDYNFLKFLVDYSQKAPYNISSKISEVITTIINDQYHRIKQQFYKQHDDDFFSSVDDNNSILFYNHFNNQHDGLKLKVLSNEKIVDEQLNNVFKELNGLTSMLERAEKEFKCNESKCIGMCPVKKNYWILLFQINTFETIKQMITTLENNHSHQTNPTVFNLLVTLITAYNQFGIEHINDVKLFIKEHFITYLMQTSYSLINKTIQQLVNADPRIVKECYDLAMQEMVNGNHNISLLSFLVNFEERHPILFPDVLQIIDINQLTLPDNLNLTKTIKLFINSPKYSSYTPQVISLLDSQRPLNSRNTLHPLISLLMKSIYTINSANIDLYLKLLKETIQFLPFEEENTIINKNIIVELHVGDMFVNGLLQLYNSSEKNGKLFLLKFFIHHQTCSGLYNLQFHMIDMLNDTDFQVRNEVQVMLEQFLRLYKNYNITKGVECFEKSSLKDEHKYLSALASVINSNKEDVTNPVKMALIELLHYSPQYHQMKSFKNNVILQFMKVFNIRIQFMKTIFTAEELELLKSNEVPSYLI